MLACFKEFGKYPCTIDKFTIFVIIGRSTFKHFFTSHVGIGSKSHDVEGDLDTMSRTTSSDTDENSMNFAVVVTFNWQDSSSFGAVFRVSLMRLILSAKKSENRSTSGISDDWALGRILADLGLHRVLILANRSRELQFSSWDLWKSHLAFLISSWYRCASSLKICLWISSLDFIHFRSHRRTWRFASRSSSSNHGAWGLHVIRLVMRGECLSRSSDKTDSYWSINESRSEDWDKCNCDNKISWQKLSMSVFFSLRIVISILTGSGLPMLAEQIMATWSDGR